MTTRDLDVNATVRITVNDPSAISRCVDNEDGWRESYYNLRTEDEVLEHFAYNAVVNGVTDVSQLDGWADLAYDAVTMRVKVDAIS